MRHISTSTVLRNANGDFTNCGLSFFHANPVIVLDIPHMKVICADGTVYYGEPDQVAIRQYCHKNKLPEKQVLILDTRPNNDIYPPILRPLDALWKAHDGQMRIGPMAGGNYLHYKDHEKNWDEFVYAIHDRYETDQEYDTLSK